MAQSADWAGAATVQTTVKAWQGQAALLQTNGWAV